MITDLFFVAAALLGGLAGSITDLKIREVPNWISYSMIAFGLGGYAILSLLTKSFSPVLYSLAGAGIFFVVAMAMFYTGAWGGGDTKMLIGFGALLPIYPKVLLNWLNPALAIWPFVFTLWINILIFGAIIGLVFGFYILAKNWNKFVAEIKKVAAAYRILIHLATITALIPIILYLFKLQMALITAFIWAVCVVFFYIFLFTKSVENISMYKALRVGALTEGDWIVGDVFSRGKLIYKPKKTGITEAEISRLIKSGIKSVKVKEGLPMIPAFFIGLVVSLIFGDLMFWLLKFFF